MKIIKQFFNTTGEDKKTEILEGLKNKTQNEKIYEIFKENPGSSFSAWLIQARTGMLITSVRRALNTLEREGKIYQVTHENGEPKKRKGKFGRNELIWKLKNI